MESSFVANPLNDLSKITLNLELCKICNIDCDNCYLSLENRIKNKKLFKKEWLKNLAESHVIKNSNYLYVTIVGGELSTLDTKYLEEIIDEIKLLWPKALFSIVSNFYELKPSFVNLYKKHSYLLETTFDFGRKTFGKDKNKSTEAFLISFKKFIEDFSYQSKEKIIDFNYALNKDSFDFGVEKALDYFSSFSLPPGKQIDIRFDHAIDFQDFRSKNMPCDIRSGYPIINTEISYDQFLNYVLSFKKLRDERKINNIYIPQLETKNISSDERFYGTVGGRKVIAVNCEGDITINPIFVELKSTFIGNIAKDSLDDCLKSRKYNLLCAKEIKRSIECHDCEFYSACGGGSLYLGKNDIYGSKECVGVKGFLNFTEGKYETS